MVGPIGSFQPEKLQVTVTQARRHRAGAHQGIRPMTLADGLFSRSSLIACVATIGVAAQQGQFRSGIELVSLNVTVTDGAKYVTGS